MRADATITVKAASTAESCQGIPYPGTTTCWTGLVRYYDPDRLEGFMKGEYISGADNPRKITFYEKSGSSPNYNYNALIKQENVASTSSQSKVRVLESGTESYFCINAGDTHTRVNKATTDGAACATSSSGGMCYSRSTSTKYPRQYNAFDATTGAMATITGTSIDVEYNEADRGATLGTGCNAGSSGRGSWASCGSGSAPANKIFLDGAKARDQSNVEYTLHHSNSKIEKYQIEELTADAVFAKYHIMTEGQDSSNSNAWTQWILGRNAGGSNNVLNVMYKRVNSGSWGAFSAGSSGETKDVGTTTFDTQGARIGATFYTGAAYISNQWAFQIHGGDMVYNPSTGKFYAEKFVSLMPPDADVDLICPSICENNNGGTCTDYEWYKKGCPKQDWNGLTSGTGISSQSTQCTGSSCNYYGPWSSDTAYQYKFKTSDVSLYALQNNAGSSISATKVDTSAATFSTEDSNEYYQTLEVKMIPGTSTAAYDTKAEVEAYYRTAGNFFYKVKIGREGGHEGWNFYAKKTSDSTWLTLNAPLQCSITMQQSFDANNANTNNGAVYDLVLYEGQTEGLSWEQLKVGNTNVGETDTHVASPQIANGALCTADSASYRLKSSFTMVLLTEAAGQCSAFDTMTDAGAVPSATEDPANKATADADLPTTTKKCINLMKYTNAAGCTYVTDAGQIL